VARNRDPAEGIHQHYGNGERIGCGGLVAGESVHRHHLYPRCEVGGLGGQPVGQCSS
jgi:hypothetical protein